MTDIEICEQAINQAMPIIEVRYNGDAEELMIACNEVEADQSSPTTWELSLHFWEGPDQISDTGLYQSERLRVTYVAEDEKPCQIERLTAGGR